MSNNPYNQAKTTGELPNQVASALIDRRLRLTTAESCTGGSLAAALCAEADTAAFYDIGLITFSDRAKQQLLDVNASTLEKYSAVSRQTVEEMSTGALARSGADISIAISGYAGPDGGDDGTPAGTVWFAWNFRGEIDAHKTLFSGECQDVVEKAVRYSLAMLMEKLPGWQSAYHTLIAEVFMAVMAITGGTAGVGKATALRFAQAGYDVGIIARDDRSLEATKRELLRYGVRVRTVEADVDHAEALLAAAGEIENRLGAIDVWVNNAMCAVLAPFRTMTHDEFVRVTEVTYLGYVNGTRAALALMTPRDRGVIIQVGSALAYRSIPLQSAYCGAKAAIRGFTDAVRTELMHENSGVSIAMVQMPGLNTPQFEWARNKFAWAMRPVPPVFQPEVAAQAIFNVARRPVRELWVGSSTIQSIVGQFLFPGLLDRLMVKKAWEGQMTRHLNADDRQDYLEQPVRGLHKTHGRFSSEAKYRATAITSGVPGKALLGGAAAVGLLLARWLTSRKHR